MYKCKHFKIYELTDPVTYKAYGEQAWDFFTDEILMSIDGVRDFFGVSVTANDWYWRGNLQWRGYRPKWCQIGATRSQHRICNAVDCDIKGISAEHARQEIVANKDDPRLQHIMRLEGEVNWLHLDCKPTENRIRVFNP